jgi:hypothetical protein
MAFNEVARFSSGLVGGLFKGKGSTKGFDADFLMKVEQYGKGSNRRAGGGPIQYNEKFQKALREWDAMNGTITRFGQGTVPIMQNQESSAQSSAGGGAPASRTMREGGGVGESITNAFAGAGLNMWIAIAGLVVGLIVLLKPKKRRKRR